MSTNQIATVADLIKVFGGPKATAELLGTTPQNVVNWRAAGKIPARFHKLHRSKLAATRKRLSVSDGLWNFVEVV